MQPIQQCQVTVMNKLISTSRLHVLFLKNKWLLEELRDLWFHAYLFLSFCLVSHILSISKVNRSSNTLNMISTLYRLQTTQLNSTLRRACGPRLKRSIMITRVPFLILASLEFTFKENSNGGFAICHLTDSCKMIKKTRRSPGLLWLLLRTIIQRSSINLWKEELTSKLNNGISWKQ